MLALLQDEAGGDAVLAALPGASLSTATLAEVVGKLVDGGVAAGRLHATLRGSGVRVVPLNAEDAELAGAMRALPGGRSLSLGDRCCLALAARSLPAEVLTADGAWAHLGLPLRARVIR